MPADHLLTLSTVGVGVTAAVAAASRHGSQLVDEYEARLSQLRDDAAIRQRDAEGRAIAAKIAATRDSVRSSVMSAALVACGAFVLYARSSTHRFQKMAAVHADAHASIVRLSRGHQSELARAARVRYALLATVDKLEASSAQPVLVDALHHAGISAFRPTIGDSFDGMRMEASESSTAGSSTARQSSGGVVVAVVRSGLQLTSDSTLLRPAQVELQLHLDDVGTDACEDGA